jgi:2-phospho-L-lactate guanylyltransferase
MTMVRHVAAVLARMAAISEIRMVAPVDPELSGSRWIADEGRGLNSELASARETLAGAPVLFLHTDLPLLKAEDVTALLDAAADGAAIAPDGAGAGTNALAIRDGRAFAPAFGVDSLSRHRAALPDASLVEREGLGLNVDDPATLEAALARGLAFSR